MNIDGYALVTGAGSGIGLACARTYAAEGAAGVAFADIDKAAAEKAAAESKTIATHAGYRAIVIQVNVTDAKQVENMVSEVVKEFGRIDYAVNCAGVALIETVEMSESSIEDFDRVYQVNVMGLLLSIRAETAAMKAQEARAIAKSNPLRGETRGVVINMGSVASCVGVPGMSAYVASKHAVLGLTKCAALDCASHAIRVNSVCPAWVDTPMVQALEAKVPEVRTSVAKSVPLGRIAQTDEIADVVIFLSSPRSSYVTGASWMIDGGMTAAP